MNPYAAPRPAYNHNQGNRETPWLWCALFVMTLLAVNLVYENIKLQRKMKLERERIEIYQDWLIDYVEERLRNRP